MEGLGELGFWLAAGAVVVALIIRGWLRERDKREMIHDLLKSEGDGKITEVLAYLREKEAEERKLTRRIWGFGSGNSEDTGPTAALVVASIVGILAFIGGLLSFSLLSARWPAPFDAIGMMILFWLAGGLVAWLIIRFGGKRKHGSSPEA